MMKPAHILAACLAVNAGLASAAECSAVSGPNRTPLLELYTSEGCSSCPPADRWLSRLQAQGYGRDKLVPLALHVDYWDYIGWQDRFAQSLFAERQRTLAALGNARVVYTPQILLNGRDFRSATSSARLDSAIAAIRSEPAHAAIRLNLKLGVDQVQVEAAAQADKPTNAALYVALYENDLSSMVKAGENSGSTLHHDYVVRAWRGPYAVGVPLKETIALPATWKRGDLGAAAFVQDKASGEILQAISLPLCS
jgi:hypothetical protein